MYVRWKDLSEFDEGKSPYGENGLVFGTVVGFVVIRDLTHAVIRPKHNQKLINLPIDKIEEVE